MNIKINILRIILIILLVIICGVIFGFSNQEGEESSGISRKITEKITQNIQAIQKLEVKEKEKVLRKIEHYVRKLAHFSLYTVVGILSMSLMSTYNLTNNKKISYSFIIGASYAISDEFHQMFVMDRTASVLDVGIDGLGVIAGISIVFFIISFIKKKQIQ